MWYQFTIGSMKLASGLRYFKTSESNIIHDEREGSPMGSESSIMIKNLNEYENWYGKGRPLKINNTLEKSKVTDKFTNSEYDTVGSKVDYLYSSINNFDVEPMANIQCDLESEPIENPPLIMKSVIPKKKKSKYLNPDKEWITIPEENVFSPSKMGLLPNGGTIIGGNICPNDKGKTYTLSNTCGFDSLLQLLGVAYCDSIHLRSSTENDRGIELVVNLALELTKNNYIGKTVLNSRLNILRNIFPTEDLPNNVVRINCDCNVVQVVQKLNVRSVIEKKICTNHNCLKKIKELSFPTLLLQFHNDSINHLQTKIDQYVQFQPANQICKEIIDNKECNGSLICTKFYGPLHILSFSCSTDKNQKYPNEFINCMLSEIPNIVEINKKTIMLRGIVAYNPPLNGISALGHYICYA